MWKNLRRGEKKMIRRWKSGWLCVLGMLMMLCLCVFVAEGGGEKKKSLLVLPVDYVEGMTGSSKASEPLTDDLRDVVEKKGAYRLLSPALGFQRLAGMSGNLSSLSKLLGRSEKPDKVLYVKVTKVGERYILRGALYQQRGGEWSVERKKVLNQKGKESYVSGWLGEIYDALFLPKAGTRKIFTAGGASFAMRWIPSGSFMMGSPSDEYGRRSNEGPQRRVEISKGFWMLETEVTQGQYKALMGSNPSKFKKCGDNCPVEMVKWNDVRRFASKLSRAQGLSVCSERDRGIFKCVGWRLPTEAEWEYAARAGTTGARHGELNEVAWWGAFVGYGNAEVSYDGAYEAHGKKWGTHPVGEKGANAWGLHDMLGNVSEITIDVYKDSYKGMGTRDPLCTDNGTMRVSRGGCWASAARYVRSANRDNGTPKYSFNFVGFRLLRY